MKKPVILLTLLIILSMNAAALKIINTQAEGQNPVLYGSITAFETSEKSIEKDLNNDGDTQDTVIRYYNIDTGDTLNTEIAGKNPSIFAYTIVFETSEKEQGTDLNADNDTEDNVILYYNIKERKVISTTAEGHNPSIYADYISFSTPESRLGIDYNNDGDQQDEIIRFYKLSTKELTNTRAAGLNPAVSDGYVIFETLEKDEDKDLNKDQDKNDIVLRYFIMETSKTLSTFAEGQEPRLNEENVAAFASQDGMLQFYRIPTQEMEQTGIKARQPAITNNLAAFVQNEKISVYDLDKNSYTLNEVYGASPSVFENKLAFATNEALTGDLNMDGDSTDSIIRVILGEDSDRDGVYDFADNCPETENQNQSDRDMDAEGDACDPDTKEEAEENKEETTEAREDTEDMEEESPEKTSKPPDVSESQDKPNAEETSEPKPLPQPKSFTVAKKKGPGFFTWFLIILAILAGLGCIAYAAVFGLGKKKRKFKF